MIYYDIILSRLTMTFTYKLNAIALLFCGGVTVAVAAPPAVSLPNTGLPSGIKYPEMMSLRKS